MKTRRIIFMGLLIACSLIGANLKIFSSIALDSLPAFLGSLLLGPVYGGVIGSIGHFLTASTSGFPYGLPTHLVTMLSMFIAVYLFGKLQEVMSKRINKSVGVLISVLIAVIFNGPIALLMVTPIIGIGAMALTPVLSIGAAVNIILAQAVYLAIPVVIKDKYKELWKWR